MRLNSELIKKTGALVVLLGAAIFLARAQTVGPTPGTTSPGGTPGQIQWNDNGAFAGMTMGGDCSLAPAWNITCTKTNGSDFGTAATVNIGTSGATVPLLNGVNTWANVQVLGSALSATAGVQTGGVAVASLPTCNSSRLGLRLVVNNALLPVVLSVVGAGGSVVVPVICNGTSWIVG